MNKTPYPAETERFLNSVNAQILSCNVYAHTLVGETHMYQSKSSDSGNPKKIDGLNGFRQLPKITFFDGHNNGWIDLGYPHDSENRGLRIAVSRKIFFGGGIFFLECRQYYGLDGRGLPKLQILDALDTDNIHPALLTQVSASLKELADRIPKLHWVKQADFANPHKAHIPSQLDWIAKTIEEEGL